MEIAREIHAAAWPYGSLYEKSVPYYANERDVGAAQGDRLTLYDALEEIRSEAMRDLNDADLAIATSYCPEGAAVCPLMLGSRAGIRAFYDLDIPVTLSGRCERSIRRSSVPAGPRSTSPAG